MIAEAVAIVCQKAPWFEGNRHRESSNGPGLLISIIPVQNALSCACYVPLRTAAPCLSQVGPCSRPKGLTAPSAFFFWLRLRLKDTASGAASTQSQLCKNEDERQLVSCWMKVLVLEPLRATCPNFQQVSAALWDCLLPLFVFVSSLLSQDTFHRFDSASS